MTKTLKYFSYFLILVVSFILYELISIDGSYLNRSTITLDVNNVRNPQVKKIVRGTDNLLAYFYFSISKKKQREFYEVDRDYYNNLPDRIIVNPKLDNLTIANGKSINNEKDWKRSHGNHLSNKFSNLKKINKDNIDLLDVAWVHTFEKKGIITVSSDHDADQIMEVSIEAGAEDIEINEDNTVTVSSSPEEFEKIKSALIDNEIEINDSEISLVPETSVQADLETSLKVYKLLEMLEDLDDTQSVTSNIEFAEGMLEHLD